MISQGKQISEKYEQYVTVLELLELTQMQETPGNYFKDLLLIAVQRWHRNSEKRK